MDDESDSIKRITSKKELEQIKVDYYREWEKRYIPKIRHIIKIRKFIKDDGNFVKHERLVYFIQSEFGFKKAIVNKMLDYMVENNIINEMYWKHRLDLRYFISED